MIPHLSSQQLSEHLLGQPSVAAARHVRDCAACRAQLERNREELEEFGAAVRAWSAGEADRYQINMAQAAPASAPEPLSWRASRQLAWALLIAAIFAIASLVLPRHSGESAASDAALLQRVDAEVSRTVPSSMEPLMKLVVQEQ